MSQVKTNNFSPSADDSLDTIAVPRAIVKYNGTVTAVFPRILKSTCPITVKDFPFDQQVMIPTLYIRAKNTQKNFGIIHIDFITLMLITIIKFLYQITFQGLRTSIRILSIRHLTHGRSSVVNKRYLKTRTYEISGKWRMVNRRYTSRVWKRVPCFLQHNRVCADVLQVGAPS